MRRVFIIALLILALVVPFAQPAQAASLGISPSSIKISLREGSNTSANFQVYYFTGSLKVDVVGVPVEVTPSRFNVSAWPHSERLKFSANGNCAGSYKGYLRFSGSREDVSLSINVNIDVVVEANVTEYDTGGYGSGGGSSAYDPLRIYDLEVDDVTDSSAQISWKTNASTIYTLTYDGDSVLNLDAWRTEHVVDLTDLLPYSTYLFTIICTDYDGYTDTKGGSFKTDARPRVPEEPATPPEPEVPPTPEPPVEPSELTPTPPTVVPTQVPTKPLSPLVEYRWLFIGGGIVLVLVVLGILWITRKPKNPYARHER